MTLYTYTIPWDDGSAPNVAGNLCTLAICKPAIRRVAVRGDWVAGLGSRRRELQGRLVYAMRVERVISLQEFDRLAPEQWPEKIPDFHSIDTSRRLGDCIYEFSECGVRQRPGVHGPGNMKKDLGGRNALLSCDFYYFGASAIEVPNHLKGILHPNQGHRSRSNQQLEAPFVQWIRGFTRGVHGMPDFCVDWTGNVGGYGDGYAQRAQDDERIMAEDEESP